MAMLMDWFSPRAGRVAPIMASEPEPNATDEDDESLDEADIASLARRYQFGNRTSQQGLVIVTVALAVALAVVSFQRPSSSNQSALPGMVNLSAVGLCAEDGEDCRGWNACCNPEAKCYVKNAGWASCEPKCPGTDPKVKSLWACTLYGRAVSNPPNLYVPNVASLPESLPSTVTLPKPAALPSSVGIAGVPSSPVALGSRTSFPDIGQDLATHKSKPENQDIAQVAAKQIPVEEKTKNESTGKVMNIPAATDRECSWEGEDCSDTKCCRRLNFTCFEKRAGWASCSRSCKLLQNFSHDDGQWSCKKLGGDQGVIEIAPSSNPAGTTLFCFSVVTPNAEAPRGVQSGYEQSIIDFQKQHQKPIGIFACDGHSVFSGAKAKKGDWDSVANTDIFTKIWGQVKSEGRFKDYDWTVKVDVDAVFFPDRLRAHIKSMSPPANTAVYLHNIKFKFHFMGALEVLSRDAAITFMENAYTCGKYLGHKGGEDHFTLECLDAFKVGHMTDFSLLDDKYTHREEWNLYDINLCGNPNIVAFHPYKAVSAWEACRRVALNINKASDFVDCKHRWHADACSLASGLKHQGIDAKDGSGLVGSAWGILHGHG